MSILEVQNNATRATAVTALTSVVVLAALLACKSEDESAQKSKAEPAAAAPQAPATATAAATQPVAQPVAPPTPTPAPAPAAAASPIPDIPEGRSKPPTVAEWTAAAEVNTQEVNSQPPGCSMKVVREWLQVRCQGKEWVRADSIQDFGTPNADFFTMERPGSLFSYVLRLKKGKSPKVRIYRDKGGYASLFINWPPSADKPLHIALGKAGPWY